MSEYVLEMTDVCKSFPGVKALDHAQLKLRPGKVHALMGENGAGKSTLMKCMFGIYKMDEGEITLAVERDDEGLQITVTDNGSGMSKEQIQAVLSGDMADRKEDSEGSTGIGLKNVRNRLILYFSGSFMHFSSRSDSGITGVSLSFTSSSGTVFLKTLFRK